MRLPYTYKLILRTYNSTNDIQISLIENMIIINQNLVYAKVMKATIVSPSQFLRPLP